MLYNFLAIIISILVVYCLMKKVHKDDFSIKNKIIILEASVLLIGILIRVIFIQYIPNSLNVDEASSGYEAFSILNFGIDRHGNHYPVFLESWGGGQNALLSYLMIPFIKVIGLSVLSVRLPMAIIRMYFVNSSFFNVKKNIKRKIGYSGTNVFCNMPLAHNEKQMGIRI